MRHRAESSNADEAVQSQIDSLIDVIQSTVAAQSWADVGGPATIGIYEKDGAMLFITQTDEVHKQVADLLAQLREVQARQKEDKKKDETPDPNAMVLQIYELRVSAPNSPAMT